MAFASIALLGQVLAEPHAGKQERDPSYFDTRPLIDYSVLAEGFANPPLEARMRVWWFWHAGQATKQSITQDLEAMEAKGIGGALICDNRANLVDPPGPVFMSEGWKEYFAHAVREADRLGIELSLNIQSGCGDPGHPNVANDNGLKVLVSSTTTVSGGRVEVTLPMPGANEIYYEDIAVQAFPKHAGQTGEKAIRHWGIKTFEQAGYYADRKDVNADNYLKTFDDEGREHAVDPAEVRDLTAHFKDGVLRWEAPEGEWTVIRYGMTSTGKRNNYASAGYSGGLCYDPIHQDGIDSQWNEVAKPLIEIAKANGSSLKFVHLDSWEMRACNWTHDMEASFERRRGYDMRPFLPVLAGHLVTSREVSNRFLEDFRLTVADLVAEENYEVLRDYAHGQGVSLHMESAGPHMPPVDGLRTLGINDIPMGESWARSTTHRVDEPSRMQVSLCSSAGHIYGKRFIAAESPTSVGPVWERSPGQVKNVLDRSFCKGVNRINWHTYDSSPDEFGLPGIAYMAGTHLNRQVTWWEESREFISYINRTQNMLIHGLHVADVLGYLGSRAPLFAVLHRLARNDIPDGYAWDMCNTQAFLERASVRDGRVVLPDGKSYALFALPPDPQIDLRVLRKIEKLVAEGMVLVGNPPQRSFGLSGYPASDRELAAIVERLWGKADGSTAAMKTHGKGTVFSGQPVSAVLEQWKIGPDLKWEPRDQVDLEYIHHRSADGELDFYYVVNKWERHGINDLNYRYFTDLPDRYLNLRCSFRVDGERIVERWDPVRGTITPVRVVERSGGYHHLPVSLEPEGGAFYVFRRGKPPQEVTGITRDGTLIHEGNTALDVGAAGVFLRRDGLEVLEPGRYALRFANGKNRLFEHSASPLKKRLSGEWKVKFLENPTLGEPFRKSYPELRCWTKSEDRLERYYSGAALYNKSFALEQSVIGDQQRAYLDLGFVGDIATVWINGEEVGLRWKAPYRFDITNYLKTGENHLEVRVTNLWINRLIGDQKLPDEQRRTNTDKLRNERLTGRLRKPDADKYLRASGLIGPVEIHFSQVHGF